MAPTFKKLRKSKGWTQAELAEKLKATQKVVSDYETGKRKPPIERLPVMARLFNVTMEELIGKKSVSIDMKRWTNRTHKNRRTARVQKLFAKLHENDQRSILKQIKGLVGQK